MKQCWDAISSKRLDIGILFDKIETLLSSSFMVFWLMNEINGQALWPNFINATIIHKGIIFIYICMTLNYHYIINESRGVW